MNITEKKITELKPYENNPRNNAEAVEYVANSIKEFGFKVPIVIDKNGVIVAGHTRYEAAKVLGLDKVPVVIADDLTDKQIKAFRIADNKTAEKAGWDYQKLTEELENIIPNYDLKEFGFGEFELDVLMNKNEIEEGDFEDLSTSISVNSNDGKDKVTLSYASEEEEEWIKKALGVEEIKKSFDVKDLMEKVSK